MPYVLIYWFIVLTGNVSVIHSDKLEIENLTLCVRAMESIMLHQRNEHMRFITGSCIKVREE